MRQRETNVQVTRGIDRLTDVLGDPLIDALATTATGAFVTDGGGRIVLWNGAAEAMLGYSEADALGRPVGALLPSDGANRPVESMSAEPAPLFDMLVHGKAGTDIWIGVLALKLAHAPTGTSLVVHLFRDISSLKERGDGGAPNGAAAPLTRREREILQLMGDGLNTAAMARRLHLSRATIRNHVQNILLKLDVHSRLEAVALGRRHRLL